MKTSTFFMTLNQANEYADSQKNAYSVIVGSVSKAYKEKGNFVVTVCTEDEIENIKEVKEIEFTKISTGYFQVNINSSPSGYYIINTWAGHSEGSNWYAIMKEGQVKISGMTLQKAKKTIKHWLTK